MEQVDIIPTKRGNALSVLMLRALCHYYQDRVSLITLNCTPWSAEDQIRVNSIGDGTIPIRNPNPIPNLNECSQKIARTFAKTGYQQARGNTHYMYLETAEAPTAALEVDMSASILELQDEPPPLSELDQELRDALQKEDPILIADLVRRGANVTSAKALHICAASGFMVSMRALLALGANVNERDGSGLTPLMLTSEPMSVPMLRLLLASGADAGAVDNEGRDVMALFKNVLKDNGQFRMTFRVAERSEDTDT